MIQLTADNPGQFMNTLVSGELFDTFLLYELAMDMTYHMSIDGKVNPDALRDEEKADYDEIAYMPWPKIKPMILAAIKHASKPLAMKLVLTLPLKATMDIQYRTKPDLAQPPVQGFLINIHYNGQTVTVTTAVNYKDFILDKSFEQAFEQMMIQYFKKHQLLMLQQ